MATVTVNINATDNMSAVIAGIQAQLNQLQRQANINIGGQARQQVGQMVDYSTRLFENMLNSIDTKLWKTFTNNLKSAYNEIKAIDDELVVVRRVTGKTNEELAGMSQNAMKVAQAYGVAASKYLAGVADFTRAGYQDQAEGLAELSVKLQRAGDVSADVANQYILAIDKAYGLQGNIEALTAAMDGANQIGNEYATNVGEIAAGIGKIATIASTAHVGINELTAALGTITAVTQRSGTEAATALRAIFLNIMGDTSTEIEEGAKWTAGEIEGLRQVLELYAPEVVRAAEATGTLIDPMEAIGALAKSYQDGILTEAKLFSMVSDIGGKLRTNQLMVLIKSWDMYQSMLNTYANASGSIAKEVENSLDSITVKTERLKASWVALVNNTVSTSMIKGVLDGLNTVVQAVDNLGNALTIVLGLVTALKAQRIATLFAGVSGGGAAQIANLTASVRGFGLAITAIGVALSTANGIIKAHNDNLDKSAQAAIQSGVKAGQSSQEIMKLYSTYVTAKSGTEAYTTALLALAEALGLTAQEAENAGDSIKDLTLKKMDQAVADAKTAIQEYNKNKGDTWFPKTYTVHFEEYSKDLITIVNKYKELYEMTDRDVAIFDTTTSLSNLITQYKAAEEMQAELRLFADQNGINIVNFKPYMEVSKYLQETNDQYREALSLMEAYTTAEADRQVLRMSGFDDMRRAMSQLAEDGKVSESTLQEYAKIWDELIASIKDTDFEGFGKYVRESIVGILDKEFPQIAKYSKQWAEMMNADGSGMTQSVDKTADSVNRLAQALSTATKAKNAFDEAMKQDAENKGFEDYQSAYSAYAEEIKAGRVNSRRAMAAAEYLMAGSDKYDFAKIYAEKGYAGVNAAMQKGPWETVYGNAEKTYGEGFVKLLDKLVNKNGEIVDSNNQVVMSYKNVDGKVKFTIDDMWGLADATDMSVAQVWQALQALSVYGEIDTGVEEFTNQLEALGEQAEFLSTNVDTGKLVVDYEKLREFMSGSGASESEWMKMKDWLYLLNEIGEVEMANVPDVKEGWQNYYDFTEEMQKSSKTAKEAKESLAGMVSEAQAAASGLSNVTPQVATMNNFLNDMRLAGNDQGANDMLARLSAAAQAAGGSLEVVDGKIASLKDSAGKDADWKFLEQLINETQLAAAAATEDGVLITGLEDKDYKITFSVDPDGTAALQINELVAGTEDVAKTRTVNFDANGNIANISDVEIQAEDAARTRFIEYNTDGQVKNIELVDQEANSVVTLRNITYGADDRPLTAELSVIDNKADTPTKKERFVRFGGNDDDLGASIFNVQKISQQGAKDASKDAEVEFSGNADGVEETVNEVNELVATSTQTVNGGELGEYELEATASGVEEGVEEAEGIIQGSIETADTTYTLRAVVEPPKFTDTFDPDSPYYFGKVFFDPFNPESDNYIGKVAEEAQIPLAQKLGFLNSVTTPPAENSTGKDLLTTLNEAIKAVLNGETERANWPKDSSGRTDWTPTEGETYVEIPADRGPKGPDGRSIYEVQAELEVTADEASATEAAEEASKAAQVALGENPPPLPFAAGYDDYDLVGETDEATYYHFGVDLEDGGALEEIMAVSKLDGSEVTVTIETNGDGQQTITSCVTDADKLTDEIYTVTIDADGNAVTNLETIEELQEFIDRTIRFTVNANTSDSQNRLRRLKEMLDDIKSKTVTVTTKTESSGTGGGKLSLPTDPKRQMAFTNASGTDFFPGGYSLINEKGPEIVAANRMASIYANGFPTIAKIPRGAQIFNAEDTAAILGSRMSLPAYASGTTPVPVMEWIGQGLKSIGETVSSGISSLSKALSGATKPGGQTTGGVTIPKDPPKEEEKKTEKSSGGGGGSSSKSSEEEEEDDEFWNTIKEYIDYGLKKIQYQIEDYQNDITAIERARDALLKPIEEELEDLEYSLQMLDYEVTLLERARDDAVKPLDKEIERLEKARDLSKEQYDLEEKRQALEDARHQRTVRYFNEESGQWEWMADQKAIQEAEKAYNEALAEHEISVLKQERDAIYDQYQDQIDAFDEQEEVLRRRQEDLEHERTKIEYEYGEAIDPLQDKVDALQQTYDDLDKYYQRLVDAVEVPMENLTEALREMTAAGSNYAAQYAKTVELLDTLYGLAPTWSPVEVGDLGKYKPTTSQYGKQPQNIDQSTTVYVDGVQLEGHDAQTMKDVLRKHTLMQKK